MPPSPEDSSKAASADSEEKAGGELKEEGSVRSVSRRFLKWTSKDVFDWNPDYGRTVRGILTFLQIVLSALVMTMVGSGCKHEISFSCHSSAAFLFVVASSALIQSTLLVVCCLLSKKGDAIIKAAALELLYFLVFCVFYLIAGLVVEWNLSSNDYGHHAILAGGIFGLTNSGLYLISAIWSFMCFKRHFGGRDEK